MSLGYPSGERWLGHWVYVDLIGISSARLLSRLSASLHITSLYVEVTMCPHPSSIIQVPKFCQTSKYNDISLLFYFLFLWLPLNLSISLNACLLFGVSYKLPVHIFYPFFYCNWYHFLVFLKSWIWTFECIPFMSFLNVLKNELKT